MIYLASDDRYFSLGIKALLSAINKNVALIDLPLMQEAGVLPAFARHDTLMLAVDGVDALTRLLGAACVSGSKVLLIMDNACERTLTYSVPLSPRILSKKMPLECVPQLLDVACLKDLSFLTTQEINIMCYLASGKTPYHIARALNLSVKTISAHKFSALKKLGLSHLNSRSVFIFGLLFNGFKTRHIKHCYNINRLSIA